MALQNARKAFFYLLIPAILLVFVFSFLSTRDSTDLRYSPHNPPPLFVIPFPEDNTEQPASLLGTTAIPSEIDSKNIPFHPPSTPVLIPKDGERRTTKEQLSETHIGDNASNTNFREPAIQIDTGALYSTLDLLPYPNQTNPWTEKLAQRFRNLSTSRPLKVIIVPHSHNDPGWLNTYDQYYTHYTNAILDSAVKNLELYSNMTFVWSEMSFLSRWWEQQHSKTKFKFKQLLKDGRIEITTGGWVMTDEGSAHFYDMLDELIEGHQFLKNTLGISPKNSWSVDPFGHGATYPYLLQKSGIENMYIQRTHFAWKRRLAEKQQLEFYWRQQFQKNIYPEKPILCHMSPLELYSYKYACGPDFEVCLNFDFRRIYGENSESTAVPLDKHNIHNKSLEILEQYQKLGSMFSHNVALVLLGDDFRYNYDIEWKQQYENYEFLMDYINSNPEFFNATEIKWGTLNDYFQEIFGRKDKAYPDLIGDFMPYSDVYVNQIPNYWTGYYSTRPFLKSLNRQLQHQLRSTEILYSLARQYTRNIPDVRAKFDQEYKKLSDARQNLGLFQHHDGITGTSKDYVMADYGIRMSRSSHQMRLLGGYSLQNLALDNEYSGNFLSLILNTTNDKHHWNDLDNIKVFKVPPGEQGLQVLVFNTHLQENYEKIKIHIEDPFIRVVDAESGEKIHFQINPIFETSKLLSSTIFELEFGSKISALSLKVFRVITEEDSIREKVTIIQYDESENAENQVDQSSEVFQFEKQKVIFLENDQYKIEFESNGLMKQIQTKQDKKTYQISMDFWAYESEPVLSGAYLFKPKHNEPTSFLNYSTVDIYQVNGKQSSTLFVNYTDIAYSITLHRNDPLTVLSNGIDLRIILDIGEKPQYNDREIVLRFKSDLNSRKSPDGLRLFSTDSNGFQMLERRFVSKIGVEGNYYPMTTSIFIEDEQQMKRLTVLSSTSLGVTSPNNGMVEVMLDRRTTVDDRRGLSQGVVDNLRTELKFKLVFEALPTVLDRQLSPLSNHLLLQLNYPLTVYAAEDLSSLQQELNQNNEIKLQSRQFLPPGALCDNFLINLRTLPVNEHFNSPSNSSLLLLNKRNFNCQHSSLSKHGLHLFNDLSISTIQESSLTGLTNQHNIFNLDDIDKIALSEIGAFNVTFS